MEITQSYRRSSQASITGDGLVFDVATECHRPPVHLSAELRHSTDYARCMLALFDVVTGDLRPPPRDHSDYQAWVRERYLEALPAVMQSRQMNLDETMRQRAVTADRVKQLRRKVAELRANQSKEFWAAQAAYFKWLYKHDRDAWWVLDPVISVHPDSVIFEVFSQDESSYGRVSVPMENLAIHDDVRFGTTNIDFSVELADELRRVRSYRAASLRVGAGGVEIGTSSGSQLEKKIDLPPSWVRGFLQVQSALAFTSHHVRLSSEFVAEIVALLRSRREHTGPRSLRFTLTPGTRPSVVVEPFDIKLVEPFFEFAGGEAHEIRVWGRRRLFALETLLHHCEAVDVAFLGAGLPSCWSIALQGHRFDLVLSGWTRNDWAKAAGFSSLASTRHAASGDIDQARLVLERELRVTAETLAQHSGMSREIAQAALQHLCAVGQAMYDPHVAAYRWRLLFDKRFDLADDVSSRHQEQARRIVAENRISWIEPPRTDDSGNVHCRASVTARVNQDVALVLDADGRVAKATCTSSWHRREGLRKGPSPYIIAACLYLATWSASTDGP